MTFRDRRPILFGGGILTGNSRCTRTRTGSVRAPLSA
jgi:hypothetical protein